MLTPDPCFTSFKDSIASHTLPERFTFPFYYQPHPLCILAVEALQNHLSTQVSWQHEFGLTDDHQSVEILATGKMFGVLIVKNKQGEIGYLSAFSGKMADKNILPNFVPPVFDMLNKDGFFLEKQKLINKINHQIESLEKNPEIDVFSNKLAHAQSQFDDAIVSQRNLMVTNRKIRKEKRMAAEQGLTDSEFDAQSYKAFSIQMSRESVQDKHQLSELKITWLASIEKLEAILLPLNDEIDTLKDQRKKLSNTLQTKLFQQYKFLNQYSNEKSLSELFRDTILQKPPAGAGDCAAPKLLQYAFMHGYQPISMAEFWWGAAPKSEIRLHKKFYPACQGKCQPILAHMLEGIIMDDNPLLVNPAEGKELPVVYQDNDMAIVNKPAEFLSVPGKAIEDSVFTRVQQLFPHATGPIIVHRLDMATSGLLIVALNPRAHKKLQQQFINKTIKKRYVAVIEGDLIAKEGFIELPLTVDINDRPRQLVCYEKGKTALTKYEKFYPQPSFVAGNYGENKKLTKVYLYPKTGRTHQLRVHCAHTLGLNMPILGDDLYGNKAERLYLHAEYLALEHPISKEPMTFKVEADF
jgi:tRNA pseudouridine32 synthase/23S rRNA pseudouridine746 synthase